MAVDYQHRYDTAKETYTKVNNKKFADLEAGTSVLIPSPKDIAALIDDIPAGETRTLTELRTALADRHGADGACPVMTGMNLRVVAEVNLEALDAGVPQEDVTPVWRAIDPESPLASKVPGGPARLQNLRSS